ncbi:hypothetical protein STAFG_7325 [Streptomyces afghaniensis 772]|uniref:Uncharacterized protein n=1 Tax=Streptomyces afghaniensis 772 TaxID=1283301 RepID=S4MJ06_9ACTN|nr:hypothetical protein STAFG_7325 [Streptomyces afghaniensis 772]
MNASPKNNIPMPMPGQMPPASERFPPHQQRAGDPEIPA